MNEKGQLINYTIPNFFAIIVFYNYLFKSFFICVVLISGVRGR